jgi:hypothetical protein
MNFLIDYNLRGQAVLLWGTIAAEGWLELMPIRFVGFEEVGLLENSSDRLVWQVAQANQMIGQVADWLDDLSADRGTHGWAGTRCGLILARIGWHGQAGAEEGDF